VAFPHAGGAASSCRWWIEHLPPAVDVLAARLPGREERISEPVTTDLDQLVTALAGALACEPAVPTVLFGHSFGASVAFEVACRLEASGAPVAGLVVSGRGAPPTRPPAPLALGDDELWADVRRLGGTEAAVLDDPAIRSIALPALRADYRMSQAYWRPAGLALRCPVLALVGDADPDVTVADLEPWSAVTAGPSAIRVLAGDHFFLYRQGADVAAAALGLLGAGVGHDRR
jgi:pyochelin biosynthetic protein PchC